MTWAAIDWRSKTLTVEAHTAKTGRLRRIPLNATALDALKRWKEQREQGVRQEARTALIFPGGTGPSTHGRQKGWEKLLERASVNHFRWHDLRHTFASWLVQRGVSLYQVKELMGHSSIALTERYAHLAPDQGRTAVASLDTDTNHTRHSH